MIQVPSLPENLLIYDCLGLKYIRRPLFILIIKQKRFSQNKTNYNVKRLGMACEFNRYSLS